MRRKEVKDQESLEFYSKFNRNALNKHGQTWEEEIQATIDANPPLNFHEDELELMKPVSERIGLETAAQREKRLYGK